MKEVLKCALFLLIALLLVNCGKNNSKNGAIHDFLPDDTFLAIKFSEGPQQLARFESFKNELIKNKLLSVYTNFEPYTSLTAEATLLDYLKPNSTSLLCFSIDTDSIPAYTFIAKTSPRLFEIDTLVNTKIDTISYDDQSIRRVTFDKEVVYVATKDSVFVVSSSEAQLKAILDGNTLANKEFQKIYSMNHNGDFSIISAAEKLAVSDSISRDFASWTSMDITMIPDGLIATGVAMARDTIPQLLSVFEGQIPQKNEIASVIPTSAQKALTFTFSDADLLQNKLRLLRGERISESLSDVFGSINEIGEIRLASGTAIMAKSIDSEISIELLLQYTSENISFREVIIHSFNESNLFVDAFYPLVQSTLPNFYFQLDNFFVFTETKEMAELIITAFKNNNCLNKSSYYEVQQSELSSASSLLLFKMQGDISAKVSTFFEKNETSSGITSIKNYPLAALQYSYDRDFAHVNFVCKEASSTKPSSGMVSEFFSLTLPNELMTDPQFFSNHRTQGKDIVVQDVANTLYLITSNGKIAWKKQLDGPILGKINEVDLLRNGKKQLAFATQKTFYILDRTGKQVAPFPIKFKDPITQPLAVFDYDNNRKYRFVITQGQEVFMYDSKGKAVKGFTFKKAKSNIVLPPEHIRVGNKDYILIAEDNGKLNILSRVGKSRIDVPKKFKFSAIPIEKEGSKFVVITSDNKKESIDQTGKVSSLDLNVSTNYFFTIKGNTKVTLDDNLLRINGKLAELPYGIYTAPQIFFANRNTYITITETQEKKIYIYDTGGALLPGLPVYGTSKAAISEFGKREKMKVVVVGDANEVILYQFQ
jgi:hypothetical protein